MTIATCKLCHGIFCQSNSPIGTCRTCLLKQVTNRNVSLRDYWGNSCSITVYRVTHNFCTPEKCYNTQWYRHKIDSYQPAKLSQIAYDTALACRVPLKTPEEKYFFANVDKHYFRAKTSTIWIDTECTIR